MGGRKMNNRIFLTVAVSALLLFTGCRTYVSTGKAVSPARHSVNKVTEEELIRKKLVKDINRFKSLILSEQTDYKSKEEEAKRLIKYLQRRRIEYMAYPEITAMIDTINKLAENIYSYTYYMTRINDGYQLLMSGQINDIQSKIQESDNLRKIAEKALSEKELWTKPELERIRVLKRFADRQYYGTQCTAVLLLAEKQFREAKTHKIANDACEKAMEAIEKTLNLDDLWSYSEKERLAAIYAKFKRKQDMTVNEFERLVQKYRDNLLYQQRLFANKQAAKDINEAAGLLKREEDKWLNWEFFGCPRDNLHSLYRALKLAERPIRSRLVSSNLRNRAAQVYNRIYRRFSPDEKQEASRYSTLPSYMRMWGFPNWSVEKRAEEEWYRNRQEKDQYFDIEHTGERRMVPPIINAD